MMDGRDIGEWSGMVERITVFEVLDTENRKRRKK